MRLLKVVVKGAGLFSDGTFSMDFFASDRVSGKDGPNYNNVHRLGGLGSIYSQNVVAISGVNASGKSTALKVIRLVLQMLFAPMSARLRAPGVNMPAKMRDRFGVTVVFWEEGGLYLLDSNLRVSKSAEEGDTPRWYRIDDEVLWVLDVSRPSKSMIESPEVFKQNAKVFLRRRGAEGDDKVVPPEARRFLMSNVSIAAALLSKDEAEEDFEAKELLRTAHATEVVHAFDNSVELLEWDKATETYRLKFYGEEERLVGERSVREILSDGTITGVAMVERALEQLRVGGFVLIDEVETALNKSLVRSFIELFQSHATNPKGAQLVFSTHYVELLDYLPRKDNVYLLVRNKAFETDVVKYSDRIPRIENKKSEVVLANAIRGAMPSHPEVEGMRAYAREYVRG